MNEQQRQETVTFFMKLSSHFDSTVNMYMKSFNAVLEKVLAKIAIQKNN